MISTDEYGHWILYFLDEYYKKIARGVYYLEGSSLHLYIEGPGWYVATFDGYSIECDGRKYTKQ